MNPCYLSFFLVRCSVFTLTRYSLLVEMEDDTNFSHGADFGIAAVPLALIVSVLTLVACSDKSSDAPLVCNTQIANDTGCQFHATTR